ncbi:endonuclease/exonuclease/phosphatase family protein [Robertkochia aurantiaca]|uniref:endonuclease/exonuclease/phosphatase family protein n=1 Tax=Robertkochia aurantiaca TaxID=2873700 RepID=UPI001CCBD547|nr:endonuclease/exonuclease/phosphatase family protein [Robertkochia sp. 3YJGBD-33]
MEKLRKTIYYIVATATIILAVCSLLSILRNTESRFLKMLDFSRIQFFIASIISLILFLIVAKRWQWHDYLLVLGLAGGLIINGSYLVNYTTIVSKTVPTASEEDVSPDNQISILLANVKMTNRNAQPFLNLIQLKNPDIIIAMEIDDWWDQQLEQIETDYPYTQETINNVAYGMTLYSKSPLKDVDVNYLNNEKVPSFECTIQLKNGEDILLYSMHPVPPKHSEYFPDNEGQQETAMKTLGKKIKNSNLPIIVAGDFNDVSWGATDELTETNDLLNDVRVGRGFFNSYNAENALMRWPLDHILVTKEFRVVKLERQSDIDSDHFPIYIELVLPTGFQSK